jgi:ubiquinone biosynthesis protein COQ4
VGVGAEAKARQAEADSRLDVQTALQAMRALVRNPDDTAQVFRIIESLSGPSAQRQYQRFRATEVGRRVLAQGESLLTALADRPRLEALAEDSLGRAYLRFIDSEGITAGGLVEASVEGSTGRWRAEVIGQERELFRRRMRDMHDLWHTVTGYRGDLIGESALLAFSFAQTRSPGVALIVAVALSRAPSVYRRVIAQGFIRGVRAAWLPEQDWVSLLPLPLSTVRQLLHVDAPPVYTPVYTRDVRAARAA